MSRYWAGNVIKEIMTITRCDNGGVVMLEKKIFFFKKIHAKIFGVKCAHGIRKKYGKIVTGNVSDQKWALILLFMFFEMSHNIK